MVKSRAEFSETHYADRIVPKEEKTWLWNTAPWDPVLILVTGTSRAAWVRPKNYEGFWEQKHWEGLKRKETALTEGFMQHLKDYHIAYIYISYIIYHIDWEMQEWTSCQEPCVDVCVCLSTDSVWELEACTCHTNCMFSQTPVVKEHHFPGGRQFEIKWNYCYALWVYVTMSHAPPKSWDCLDTKE